MKIILIIASLLISGAIIISPVILHTYKMDECMEVWEGSMEPREAKFQCLKIIHPGN